MSFSEQLKKARLNIGFTQQQVADLMGITKSTYCGYETGKRQPDVSKIKQLANILNTSGDILLETGIGQTSLNERLKELRLTLELTQEEFGSKIGSARNTIANYEAGNRKPKNAIITLICKVFNVNEIWLRTGKGEMFSKISDEDRFIINLAKLSNTENEFIQNAINAFAESSPEKLKNIEEFFKECLGIK